MKKLFLFLVPGLLVLSSKIWGQSSTCLKGTYLCVDNPIDASTIASSIAGKPATICGSATTRSCWFKIKSNPTGGAVSISFDNVDPTFKVGVFSGICGSLTAVPDVGGCNIATGSFTVDFNMIGDSTYIIALDDGGVKDTSFSIEVTGASIEFPSSGGKFLFDPKIGCFDDVNDKFDVKFTNKQTLSDSNKYGSGIKVYFTDDVLVGSPVFTYFADIDSSNDTIFSYKAAGRYKPAVRVTNECIDTASSESSTGILFICDLQGAIAFRPKAGTDANNTTLSSNPQMCGFDTLMFKGTALMNPSGAPAPYDSAYVTQWKWFFGDPLSGSNDTLIVNKGDVDFNGDSSVVTHSYGGRMPPFKVTLITQGQCGPDTVKDFLVEADTFKVQVSPDQEVCEGVAIQPIDTLTTAGSPLPSLPFSFYQWSKVSGPAVTIDSVNRPLTTFNGGTNLLNPGVYIFEFIILDAEGCQARDRTQITINPRPIATLPDRIGRVCAYYPVPFDAVIPFDTVVVTSGTPPYTFLWDPITGLNNPNIQNPIATLENTQSYTLNVTDSKNCDTISNPMEVYIFPKPNPTPDPTQLCVNEEPLTADYTIEWPSGPDDEPLGPHPGPNPNDSTINPSINQPPDFVQDTIKWFPSTDYYVLDLASATGFQTIDFTDTVTITADFTKSTKPRFVGTYDFEVWATNGSTGCTDTITGSYNVYDSITSAKISATKTILCENDSTQLGMTVNIPITPPIQLTYVWFRRNVSTGFITAFSISEPPFYVKRPAGDWDFWAEVTNGDDDCSKNSDTIRVSVNEAPVAIAFAQEDTVCEAQVVTLNGSNSTYNQTPDVATITWTALGGTPIDSADKIITTSMITKSDAFELVILYDPLNGSCSDKDTVNVNFHNKPAAFFTTNKTFVCPASPDTVALNGTGSNADPRTTYLWTADNPGVTFDKNDTLITVARNVIGQTTFSLTVRDSTYTVNNGCDSTFTVSVDTVTRPSITVNIASICLNPVTIDSVRLDVTGEGNPSSYLWSVNPLTTIHDHNTDGVNDTLSAHFTVGNTYTFTVVVTDSTNMCISTLNYDFVVADSVENDISPDEVICEGDSVQLSVTVSANIVQWTNVVGPTDASLAVNGQDTTKTPLIKPVTVGGVPTTYFYRIVSTAGTCADDDTIQVTVNPVKTSPFTADAQICNGFSSTIAYTGNADQVNDIFNWNFAGGIPLPTPPTPPTPGYNGAMEVTWPGPGVYNVLLIVQTPLGCLSDSTTQQVTVVANPTSDFILTNIACISQVETAAATFTGIASGSATYAWNFGSDAIPGSAVTVGPHDIRWTTSNIKLVTLTVTEPGPGCISSETQHSIDVRQSPALELGADRQQCEGGQITLTADPGYTTYQWTGPGGPTGGNQNTLTFTATDDPPTPTVGTYSVTVTDADGCTNADNITVNLGPGYVPVIVPSQPGGVICSGQTLLLDAGAGIAYSWSTGEATQSIVVTIAGTYTVTVTDAVCGTGSASIDAEVQPVPDAGFSIDDNTICLSQQTGIINTNSNDGSLVWDWNFGAGAAANPGVGPGPHQITYTAAGTPNIMLTLTNPLTNCLSQFNVPITVNTLPTVTTNNIPVGAVCAGTSVNLTTTPGTLAAYAWSSPQNIVFGTPTNATTSATINEAGDITVTATDANGCTATDTDPVTLLPIPKAMGATFCRNTTGSIAIDATGLTVTQITWTGGPIVGANNLITCNVNPLQTTNYNAEVLYNPGCSLDVTVTANVMVADIFADQDTIAVCDATPFTTTFDATNFSSITWAPAGGLTCTVCANPTITIPGFPFCSPYTITVVDNTNGCTGIDTFNLCRANSINAEAGPDTVRLCFVEGAPCINYTLDGTASTAQTLRWVSTNPAMDVTSDTVTVCLQIPDRDNPPSYNFRLIGSSPLCTNDTDNVVVTFYEYERPDGGPDKTICGGDVTLTVQIPGTATNSWYTTTAGAVVKNQVNPLSPTVTPSLSTNPSSFVFHTTNGYGCIATDTVSVTIGGVLTPTLVPNATVCYGDSVRLTASGGTNYQFFEDGISLGVSSQINTYSFKASVTHAYHVTATAPGCNPANSVPPTTVTVRPLPIVSIIPAQIQACDGDPLQLAVDVSVSPVPTNVLWSPVTGLSIDNPTSFTPTFTSPVFGQTYDFKVIGTLNTCSDSDEVKNITVNQLPTTDAGQNDTICANDTVQIGPVGNPGASYSYSWVPANQVSNPTIYNPVTVPLLSSKSFTLFMTDNGTGCSKSDTIAVIVGAEPVYSVPPDTLFACIEDTVTISGVTSESVNKFKWIYSPGFKSINNPNSLTPSVVTFPQAATIPLVFNVTSPGGCTRNDTIFIGLYNDALANFSSDTVCAGDTIQFTDSSARAYRWLWDFGVSSVITDTSTSKNPFYIYETGGSYSVKLTINQGSKNCENTVQKVISVFGTPNAKFTMDKPDAKVFPLYTFTNQTSGLDNSMTVEWDFGDGTTLVDNGTTVTHKYTFADEDSFKVKMTVTNQDGCIDSFSLKRDIGMEAPYDYPNVFTPNGDGTNDAFIIRGLEVFQSSNLVVFNRWGSEVYRKKNYQNDWKAEGVSDGVYFWIMEYNYKTRGTLKGWLTVIR